MPAIFVMSILMMKSLVANAGWHREALIAYMVIGAIPVLVLTTKRLSLPLVDRNVSFQEHYDERPAEFRDNERWQYLVKIDYAFRVFNAPIIRGLPDKDERLGVNH